MNKNFKVIPNLEFEKLAHGFLPESLPTRLAQMLTSLYLLTLWFKNLALMCDRIYRHRKSQSREPKMN